MAFLLAIGGCVAVENDAHRIGGTVPVEAVSAPPHGGDVVLPADSPSLVDLDRGNWQSTPYLVPIANTYHWPQYRFEDPVLHKTNRQRGVAPDAARALELSQSNAEMAGEAVVAPALAIADAFWIVPRMLVRPPWVAVTSPGQWPYERRQSTFDPPDQVETQEP